MKLQFVKVNENEGTRKVLATWSDVENENVIALCYNYIEGFLQAITEETDAYFIKPSRMERDGFRCHKYHSNFEYRFEDWDGKVVTKEMLQ